jgi:hypothetical protein
LSAIREAILQRLQGRLFGYLKMQPSFKGWKSSDLWRLSTELVENNDKAVNSFLNEKNFSLGETDKAIDSVLEEVLVPEIEKL